MLLVIVGVILLFIAAALRAGDERLLPLARLFGMAGPLLLLGGLALSAFVQVDAGQIGVVKLFGSVNSGTLPPGLHMINPLANVVVFNARTQNYTMSAVHGEGSLQGDDAIRALTSDGLEVVIDVSVLYHVIPVEAPALLSEVGPDYEGVLVRPIARSRIRDATVYYQAVQLYTEKRDEFQSRIASTIKADFAIRHIELEGLLIRNISLPDAVKTTIESKIQAEQESQKMVFILDKERQEAERKRIEAQGIADGQRILTESLNDKLLRYEQIKAFRDVATSQNAKVIVMNSDSAPLILSP